MLNVKPTAHIPIYIQVIDGLRRAIARGDLRPGDRAPSVRDLAAQLRINPNTIQHAYQELERQGLLETRRGQGTFISPHVSVTDIRTTLADEAARTFLDEMERLGISRDQAARAITHLSRSRGRGQKEGGST